MNLAPIADCLSALAVSWTDNGAGENICEAIESVLQAPLVEDILSFITQYNDDHMRSVVTGDAKIGVDDVLLQIIQLYQIILSLGIRQSSSTTSVTSAPSMARGAIHGCYWFQHLMSWESLLGLTRALGDTNVTLARDSLVKSWFSFRSRVSRASTCDHVTSSSDTTSNGSSSVTDITEEVIASVLAMQEEAMGLLARILPNTSSHQVDAIRAKLMGANFFGSGDKPRLQVARIRTKTAAHSHRDSGTRYRDGGTSAVAPVKRVTLGSAALFNQATHIVGGNNHTSASLDAAAWESLGIALADICHRLSVVALAWIPSVSSVEELVIEAGKSCKCSLCILAETVKAISCTAILIYETVIPTIAHSLVSLRDIQNNPNTTVWRSMYISCVRCVMSIWECIRVSVLDLKHDSMNLQSASGCVNRESCVVGSGGVASLVQDILNAMLLLQDGGNDIKSPSGGSSLASGVIHSPLSLARDLYFTYADEVSASLGVFVQHDEIRLAYLIDCLRGSGNIESCIQKSCLYIALQHIRAVEPSKPSSSQPDTVIGNGYAMAQGASRGRVEDRTQADISTTASSALEALQGMFPDYGRAFLAACLAANSGEADRAAEAILTDNLPPAVAAMDRRAKEIIFRSRTDGQIVRTGIIAPADSTTTTTTSTTSNNTTCKGASKSTSARALGLTASEAALLKQRSVLMERQREQHAAILREYDDDFDDQYDDPEELNIGMSFGSGGPDIGSTSKKGTPSLSHHNSIKEETIYGRNLDAGPTNPTTATTTSFAASATAAMATAASHGGERVSALEARRRAKQALKATNQLKSAASASTAASNTTTTTTATTTSSSSNISNSSATSKGVRLSTTPAADVSKIREYNRLVREAESDAQFWNDMRNVNRDKQHSIRPSHFSSYTVDADVEGGDVGITDGLGVSGGGDGGSGRGFQAGSLEGALSKGTAAALGPAGTGGNRAPRQQRKDKSQPLSNRAEPSGSNNTTNSTTTAAALTATTTTTTTTTSSSSSSKPHRVNRKFDKHHQQDRRDRKFRSEGGF